MPRLGSLQGRDTDSLENTITELGDPDFTQAANSFLGAASMGINWISGTNETVFPSWNLRSLYAMSDTITLVPEPSTLTLATFGLFGLACGRRRRR